MDNNNKRLHRLKGDNIMKKITIEQIKRQYDNDGQHLEQCTTYTYTHEIRQHDNVPYYKGSDIPEYDISVKSSGFTLASAKLIKGDTVAEQLAYYIEHTASKKVVYVTKNYDGYEMNMQEFAEFVTEFGYITRESIKNGNGLKVRARKESKKMLELLAVRI